MHRSRLLVLLPAVSVLGCTDPGGATLPGSGPLVETREVVDDTLVVRVVSGSSWGEDAVLVPEVEIGVLDGDQDYMFGMLRSLAVSPEGTIYAMDAQIPALRVYAPDGSHLGTWGRQGGGPGEFAQPDGGLAVLSDGRIAVRDPGNSRMQIYAPDGTPVETWPVVPGGFSTSSPMAVSRGDTLLTPLVVDLTVDIRDWRTGLQRIAPNGQVVDTLLLPESDYQSAMVEARVEGSVSRNSVPFAPQEQVQWHPDGFFMHGVPERYAFTLLKPGEAVRIERDVELPLVLPAERAEAIAQTTHSLRYTDPNWRWNGPSVPDRKPAYAGLYAGSDGRIWVHRQGPGIEMDDPDYDPEDPDSMEDRWHDTPIWDVFDPDGTFLGTVEAPLDMSRFPAPVFRGDHVWAVSRDEFDVQRIVRYRVVPRSEVADGPR